MLDRVFDPAGLEYPSLGNGTAPGLGLPSCWARGPSEAARLAVPKSPPPPASTFTVMLQKSSASVRLGIVLIGTPAQIKEVKEGGIAASALLKVGMTLEKINGKPAGDHEKATVMLKEAEGDLTLTIRHNPALDNQSRG